jgi:trimethylamine:corrinoid methyltransferase-like protein
MRTNYVANAGVRFNMFSGDQLEALFNGVLHVLEYTGLDVLHDEARRQARAPALVHGQGCVAQIPPQLYALGA